MNDPCDKDPLEKSAGEFVKEVMPKLIKYLEAAAKTKD